MDLRIREITQGYDITNAIDRTGAYTRYYIQHSVPRFNNPTSTFDNDQYLLEIISDGVNPTFEDFMEDWLTAAQPATATCVLLETFTCYDECTPVLPEDAP